MKKPIIVTEVGINHNGDLKIAKSLIALAANNGADYVKFQKKTPELCVPGEQKNIQKLTIFGPMRYIDYKKKIEFGKKEYDEIDRYCKKFRIQWFASAWDIQSVDFLLRYNVPYLKIASACITDFDLLKKIKSSKVPVVLSTGMSTKRQIDQALDFFGKQVKYLLHCVSTYPTPDKEMNMKCIETLKSKYGSRIKIGFSNHSSKIIYTVQAYVMGVEMLEFHITLDRNMKGTDQAASIGPKGFDRIMKHINSIDDGWGDGKIKRFQSEIPVMKKLRRIL